MGYPITLIGLEMARIVVVGGGQVAAGARPVQVNTVFEGNTLSSNNDVAVTITE